MEAKDKDKGQSVRGKGTRSNWHQEQLALWHKGATGGPRIHGHASTMGFISSYQ